MQVTPDPKVAADPTISSTVQVGADPRVGADLAVGAPAGLPTVPGQDTPLPAGLPSDLTEQVQQPGSRLLWVNTIGGYTWRLAAADPVVLKWSAHPFTLRPEIERLRWLNGRFPAPQVREHGADEHGSWFTTVLLPGQSAVSEQFRARPVHTVEQLALALRHLHESLDPADCPFDSSPAAMLGAVDLGALEPRCWQAEAPGRSVREVERILADVPPPDRQVVVHGDACSPNTLLDAAGDWIALVDLGQLGVSDRWYDLALGAQAVGRNFGVEHIPRYFDVYGVRPDPERLRYYRLLADVAS